MLSFSFVNEIKCHILIDTHFALFAMAVFFDWHKKLIIFTYKLELAVFRYNDCILSLIKFNTVIINIRFIPTIIFRREDYQKGTLPKTLAILSSDQG